MSLALTEQIDVAQVVLYGFWVFFFGLILWLRREDRREGYPLESDAPKRRLSPRTQTLVPIPPPKTFLHPHGGTSQAPSFDRDTREIMARRVTQVAGAPLQPIGDPMLAGVGPASFAQREDVPELTREGRDCIVPLRVEKDFKVSAGPDPRGWDVIAADNLYAGTVTDIWVDRADAMVRYLEVELEGESKETRLLPITVLRLSGEKKKVKVGAIRAHHFKSVPTLKERDRVTILEEDRICAFYADGRLYADAKRLGPVI